MASFCESEEAFQLRLTALLMHKTLSVGLISVGAVGGVFTTGAGGVSLSPPPPPPQEIIAADINNKYIKYADGVLFIIFI
jgi:hypothetical protein